MQKIKSILTVREKEVLPYLFTTLNIQQIADKVFLTENGLKFRLSSIYKKYKVKNRLELVKKLTKMNGKA